MPHHSGIFQVCFIHDTVITVRKLSSIRDYCSVQTSPVVLVMPFVGKQSPWESQGACMCPVLRLLRKPEWFSDFLCFLLPWHFWRSQGSCLREYSSVWDWLLFHHDYIQVICLWQGHPQSGAVSSPCPMGWHAISNCPISDGVPSDHLVKVLSSKTLSPSLSSLKLLCLVCLSLDKE